MLSSVLRSPRAVEVNIAIMRTFVQLRRLMDSNRHLARRSPARTVMPAMLTGRLMATVRMRHLPVIGLTLEHHTG